MATQIDARPIRSRFVAWLSSQGVPIYSAGGVEWGRYGEALLPVRDVPIPTGPTTEEAARLFRESGALLIRYAGSPYDCSQETESWYFVVCEECPPRATLSKKVRYELRRGFDRCRVERVTAQWLAEHAYECYLSACPRHRIARPDTKDVFARNLHARSTGPFERWAVFAGDRLAGFCNNLVDDRLVSHSSAMYDPSWLKERSAYVMVRSLMEEYVGRRGLVLTNGMRAVLHDTNYDHFLVKLGFRLQHCRLELIYRPWVRLAVNLAYPFRRMLSLLPDERLGGRARGLLAMEEIRRCQPGPANPESQNSPAPASIPRDRERNLRQ